MRKFRVFSFGFRARTRAPLGWLPVLAVSAIFCAAQSAQVQNAPVTEPRGAVHDRVSPPGAKGAAAITQSHAKCVASLEVDADALFAPHRWTLNPDAAETLDALGVLIAKTGKYPASIFAETSTADSDDENRDVAHRRAVTVRTWLANHSLAPADTDIAEFTPDKPVAPAGKIAFSPGTERQRNNGMVQVIILNTCH